MAPLQIVAIYLFQLFFTLSCFLLFSFVADAPLPLFISYAIGLRCVFERSAGDQDEQVAWKGKKEGKKKRGVAVVGGPSLSLSVAFFLPLRQSKARLYNFATVSQQLYPGVLTVRHTKRRRLWESKEKMERKRAGCCAGVAASLSSSFFCSSSLFCLFLSFFPLNLFKLRDLMLSWSPSICRVAFDLCFGSRQRKRKASKRNKEAEGAGQKGWCGVAKQSSLSSLFHLFFFLLPAFYLPALHSASRLFAQYAGLISRGVAFEF